MFLGIEVPLEVASLAGAICLAGGVWAGQCVAHYRSGQQRSRSAELIRDLLKPDTLTRTIDLAARRNALRARSRAVLHGQVEHHPSSLHTSDHSLHEQVRDHIARVLRAGLRQNDRLAMGHGYDFTIDVAGADERAAVKIADRLRRRLAKLRFAHDSNAAPLSVRFGVAAAHTPQDRPHLGALARRALRVAMARGEDHVVPASEIEEIKLLPAPTPSVVSIAAAA